MEKHILLSYRKGFFFLIQEQSENEPGTSGKLPLPKQENNQGTIILKLWKYQSVNM